MKGRLAAGVVAASLALVVVGAVVIDTDTAPAATVSFSPSQCAGSTKPEEGACGRQLRLTIEALDPGDTLTILPGTYDVGRMYLGNITGTAAKRITIRGADAMHRPLLRGSTWAHRPSYVTFTLLRFEATRLDHGEALGITCGVGWTVSKSALFGADATKSVSNMNIAGRQPGPPNPDSGTECTDEPRGFLVSENVFSRPYTENSRASIYHHIYAAFEGTVRTGGTIERNVFVGNRNGAGIKLGDSRYGTLGPWNVKVRFNTFYDGGRTIVIHDIVRNNLIEWNLFASITGQGAGGVCGVGIGLVYNDASPTTNDRLVMLTNTIRHTYGYDLVHVHSPSNDRTLDVTDGGDNGPLNAGTPLDCPQPGPRPLPPRFVDPAKFGGYGLYPQEPAAQRYGRFGTG